MLKTTCVRLVDLPSGATPCLACESSTQVGCARPRSAVRKQFTFDAVMPPEAKTTDLHAAWLAPALQEAVRRGVSLGVLSLGASTSGKSRTLRGSSSSEPGLAQLAAADVARQLGDADELTISAVISTVLPTAAGAARERLIDALAPAGTTHSNLGLAVRVNYQGLPSEAPAYCEGLSKELATSAVEAAAIIDRAVSRCAAEEASGGPTRCHLLIMLGIRRLSSEGELVFQAGARRRDCAEIVQPRWERCAQCMCAHGASGEPRRLCRRRTRVRVSKAGRGGAESTQRREAGGTCESRGRPRAQSSLAGGRRARRRPLLRALPRLEVYTPSRGTARRGRRFRGVRACAV